MGHKTLISYLQKYVESIATACCQCTAKHKNKASYNTYYTDPDLIDSFGNDWEEIKMKIENKNIDHWKILHWLKIGLLLIYFLSIIWK